MCKRREPAWVEGYRQVRRSGKIVPIRPHWTPRVPCHPRL